MHDFSTVSVKIAVGKVELNNINFFKEKFYLLLEISSVR